MKKNGFLTSVALLGLGIMSTLASAAVFDINGDPTAMPGAGIAITEGFDSGTGVGSYAVQNNTGTYYLLGFGVSNLSSTAYVESIGDTFSCDVAPGFTNSWCYRALTLTSSNWGTETAYYDDSFEASTFQDIFGDFADNVGTDEQTINWYGAADGALGPGDSEDFFLYLADLPTSQTLGILTRFISSSDDVFFNQTPVSNVPLPAAAWLFGSALLGLVGLGRRRRA